LHIDALWSERLSATHILNFSLDTRHRLCHGDKRTPLVVGEKCNVGTRQLLLWSSGEGIADALDNRNTSYNRVEANVSHGLLLTCQNVVDGLECSLLGIRIVQVVRRVAEVRSKLDAKLAPQTTGARVRCTHHDDKSESQRGCRNPLHESPHCHRVLVIADGGEARRPGSVGIRVVENTRDRSQLVLRTCDTVV
jgi:hypothetical protein